VYRTRQLQQQQQEEEEQHQLLPRRQHLLHARLAGE